MKIIKYTDIRLVLVLDEWKALRSNLLSTASTLSKASLVCGQQIFARYLPISYSASPVIATRPVATGNWS
jgi:hypothetical protein